jgi:hypothetical protein
MGKLFKLLGWAAVSLAAFLTFVLQPIIGKLLTPLYGGSAGTWMTISMFFQGALLAGYALAYWLTRCRRKIAVSVMLALAIVAPLSTKLPPWGIAIGPEWPSIVVALTLSLLPALLLTTSLGIVLQDWFRAWGGGIPYYLYALSNLGSAFALLIYPFVIEPRFGLSIQINTVRILLTVLGVVVLALLLIDRGRPGVAQTAVKPEPESIPPARSLLWLFLAFSTCTMMLGAVRILSAEFGSNPISWLIPLGIYLVSFTVTFSGLWRPTLNLLSLVILAVSLFGYMTTKGVSDQALSLWPRAWLVMLVTSGCVAGNGLLYQRRPTNRFSYYYLQIAVAGLAAGVFASVIAPNLFDRNYEFAGAAILLVMGMAFFSFSRGTVLPKLAFAVVLAAPSTWLAYTGLTAREAGAVRVTHLRNHYETLIVTETSDLMLASSETTLHGAQFRKESVRRIPTAYFTRGSGVGIVLSALQQKKLSLRIGVIGLGVGTLASYTRQQDEMLFWEINPMTLRIAQEQFTFLRDCVGQVRVSMMDGRLGVKADTGIFDLLVIDAFSGDAVPMHLITREAIADYLAKLGGSGILLIHLTNRYVDLFPVVVADAKATGRNALAIASLPDKSMRAARHASGSRYAIIYPPSREAEVWSWISNAKNQAGYDYRVTTAEESKQIDWSDDRYAIIDVLNQ